MCLSLCDGCIPSSPPLPSRRLKGIRVRFLKEKEQWKPYYDSLEPQQEKLPCGWDEKLTAFQKLIILRCFRPDKVSLVHTFIV